jgi:hypothetical protein
MVLPGTRAGRIAVAFLAVFTVAMNPPVVNWVASETLVLGMAPLYAWTIAWGIVASLVLVWAAWRDAFALTERQVPPELRDESQVTTTESESVSGHAGGDD